MLKQLILLSCFFFIASFISVAQLWEHYYPPNTNTRYATCIAEDYDSGYLMTVINGNGISGQKQGFVYKLDIDGNVLWQKTIGDFTDIFTVFAICPSYDNGFILGGRCHKYDSAGAAFLMKFNSCAEKEWLREYGIYNDAEYFYVIRQTLDSNYIADERYFGVSSPDSGRVGLMKFDNNGDTLWQRDYTHYNNADLMNFHLTNDGGYYVVGRTYAPFAQSHAIKIDSAGNEQWNRLYGMSNLSNLAFDAIETPDTGYLNLTMSGTSNLKHWNYIIKTDSQGNEQWSKFVSDTNDLSERPDKIFKINDSTAIIICSVSYSYNFTTHEVYSLKAIKIDMQGNVIDSVQFGSGDNISEYSMMNKDGDIIVCGWHDTGIPNAAFAIKIKQNLTIDTLLNLTFNYDSLCSFTITNGFIPYDTATVGIWENNNDLTVGVYPNPAGETVTIETSGFENGLSREFGMKLFDLYGREVFSKYQLSSIKTKEIKLDISKFAEGIYIVVLSSGENVYRGKFVKQ